MRIIFLILAVGYVSAIFFLADSSVTHALSSFNPFSLLHVPLYAVLTILLIFSIIPIRLRHHARPSRLFISAFIAFGVAVADEIHQAFIPTRHGSVTDIFLDLAGIVLVIFVVRSAINAKAAE